MTKHTRKGVSGLIGQRIPKIIDHLGGRQTVRTCSGMVALHYGPRLNVDGLYLQGYLFLHDRESAWHKRWTEVCLTTPFTSHLFFFPSPRTTPGSIRCRRLHASALRSSEGSARPIAPTYTPSHLILMLVIFNRLHERVITDQHRESTFLDVVTILGKMHRPLIQGHGYSIAM